MQRHKWIFRPLLTIHERDEHQNTPNQKANDLRRLPSKSRPSKLETKKKHQSHSQNGDDAKPVYGFDAVPKRRLRVVYIEEEEQQEKGQAGDGKIAPKAPTPRCKIAEDAYNRQALTFKRRTK